MPNINVDYKYLKKELIAYRMKYGKHGDFDMDFLLEQERKNNMRYVDVSQCGDNFNARVYMRTANGTITTGTVKITDYKRHETTLKHVESICNLVGERASSPPNFNDSDTLTVSACKSISDRNGVLRRVSAAKTHIGQLV